MKLDLWLNILSSTQVGVWRPDGMLAIVDRAAAASSDRPSASVPPLSSTPKVLPGLKNLIKLKGGEYIAIESMEKEYATSPSGRRKGRAAPSTSVVSKRRSRDARGALRVRPERWSLVQK